MEKLNNHYTIILHHSQPPGVNQDGWASLFGEVVVEMWMFTVCCAVLVLQ